MKMNNINRFIFVLLFVALVLTIVPNVSALELNPFADSKEFYKEVKLDTSDFIKEDFNDKYGVIELRSNFMWVDTGKIAEYSLTSTREGVIELSMEGKSTLYQVGTLFDGAYYKDLTGELQTLKEGKYYIQVSKDNFVDVPDTYKEVCVDNTNSTNLTKQGEEEVKEPKLDCSQVPDTYKKENQPILSWELYKGQQLAVGDYKWKWEGNRDIGQIIDIQPVKSDKSFEEWVWFNSSFSYKKQIIINEANIDNDLYNYPLLVVLNSSNFDFAKIQGAGQDLRFVNGTETGELKYEIDYINATGAYLWVKVPYVSSSANTTLYLYYGNPSVADGQDVANVWSNNYTFVFHFSNITANSTATKDSKSGLFAISGNGVPIVYNETALIGRALSSNLSKWFTLTGIGNPNTAVFSVTALYNTYWTGGEAFFLGAGDGTSMQFRLNAGQIYYRSGGSGNINKVFAFNQPVLAVATCQDASNDMLVYNGTEKTIRANTCGTQVWPNPMIPLGWSAGAGTGFVGAIDELRFETSRRDDGWRKADYYGFNNKLLLFGAEETGASIAVANSRPAPGSNISSSSVTFDCNVTASGVNVNTVTLNVTGTKAWTQIITGLSQPNYNATFVNSTLIDGSYNWTCIADGDTADATSLFWTFNKDSTKPLISIIVPTAMNYPTNVSALNYTYSDSNPASCWYSRDGGTTNSSTTTAGTNFTDITSVEGSNNWTLFCNDTFNNVNMTSVTFFKDTLNPLIKVTYPTTNTNYTNYITAINYTVSDANLDTCKWTRDGGVTNSTITCGNNLTGLGAVEGSFTYTFYVNDTFGNVNSSSVSFLVNLTKIILNGPSDGSTALINPVTFSCNYSVNPPATVTNISLWSNIGGTWGFTKFIEIYNLSTYNETQPLTTSWGGTTLKSGMRITANKNFRIKQVYFEGDATTYYLRSNLAGPDLVSAFIVGGVATFDYDIIAGNDYYLLADSGGAGYDSRHTNGYAYKNYDLFNYTADIDNDGNEYLAHNVQVVVVGILTETGHGTNTVSTTQAITSATLWTCQICDTNNNCNFAENWTVTPDAVAPYFVLNSLNNVTSLVFPTNVTLNVTTLDATSNLATCGYFTSENATNTTYTCNTSTVVPFSNTSIIGRTITVWGLDTAGNYNSTTYSTNTWYVQHQSNATATVTEGGLSYHNLQVNMTGISSYNVTAYLVWNGTTMGYGTVTFPTANIAVINKTITIPNVPGSALNPTVNSTWYYSIPGSPNFTGTVSGTQSVYNFYINLCDATYTQKILNVTFKDETLGTFMNATMDAATFIYGYAGSSSKSYSFTNTTHNFEYDICVYPASASPINISYTLQYSHSETGTYPQRTAYYNGTLTNSTTSRILYLLNLNNGLTSNYQVITIGNQVIQGAHISITRSIGGVDTFITDGYTDASGQVSFFLNPNYDHTFTVTATGFSQQVIVIKPSQAQYTITMGTQSNPFLYTNTIEGLSYQIYPPSGIILDGIYNFSLKVSNSLTASIYNCTMNIKTSNGTFINSSTGCNAVSPGYGGTISVQINSTLYPQLYGEYYITLANNTIYYIERDAKWRNIHIVNSGGTNWADAVRDMINLPEWGDCPGGYALNSTDNKCYDQFGNQAVRGQTADFNRIVFFFLFFAIILAILNFFTGYDTAYPGAFIYLTAGIVILLSAVNGIAGPGYFYLADALKTDNMFGYFSSVINNWIVAINFTMLAVIYFFTTNKRYQAG